MMPGIDEPSDESLIALVATGDREAFSCLMDRHKDKIYRLAYKMMGNAEEAEDVTQEVFLRVWSHAGTFTPSAKFSTWIFAISANLCRSRLRSIWRRFKSLKEDYTVHLNNDTASPDKQLIRREQQARIDTAIQALPPNQRTALALWRYENLSYLEIAEVMRCSAASVESLLFRAKTTLRQKLIE